MGQKQGLVGGLLPPDLQVLLVRHRTPQDLASRVLRHRMPSPHAKSMRAGLSPVGEPTILRRTKIALHPLFPLRKEIRKVRAGTSLLWKAGVTDDTEGGGSVEFEPGGGLLDRNVADLDRSPGVILAFYGCSGHPPQERKLAGMYQGVRNRTGKQIFNGSGERKIGCKIIVKAPKCVEEALDLARPVQWIGIGPDFAAFRHRKRPIEEIAHMGERRDRRTTAIRSLVIRERIRGVPKYFGSAISECGDRVAKDVASSIHRVLFGRQRYGDLWRHAAMRFGVMAVSTSL